HALEPRDDGVLRARGRRSAERRRWPWRLARRRWPSWPLAAQRLVWRLAWRLLGAARLHRRPALVSGTVRLPLPGLRAAAVRAAGLCAPGRRGALATAGLRRAEIRRVLVLLPGPAWLLSVCRLLSRWMAT